MKTTLKKIVVFLVTLVAKGILARHNPRVVAITGSVGKTSTKDAIYTALKGTGGVRRSEKSFNSELGVPLSIIGADNAWSNPLAWLGVLGQGIAQIFARKGTYPSILVLEVGADRPGDISTIAKWLKPHVVVLTRLPEIPVHIEFFPTLESLLAEKISLARGARPDATLVLNADDPRIMEAKESLPFRSVTFGTAGERTTLLASNMQILSPDEHGGGGLAFKLDFEGKSFPVNLPHIYAESFVTVALAALAVAYALGVNMLTAIESLSDYESAPGRIRLIPGEKGTVIIDDTYNSSPAACEAGLRMLKDLPFGKRKIAIIGDMLELGKHTIDAHIAIGTLVKKTSTILIAVGVRAKDIAKGAREAGMKKIFEAHDATEAAMMMKEMRKAGDVIFVKGSQGMRMERAVKALMAEPERARELLVRQDSEWVRR